MSYNSFPHGRRCSCSICKPIPTPHFNAAIDRILKTQEQTITEAAFDAAFAKVHQTNNARFEKRDRAQWDALKAFVCKL